MTEQIQSQFETRLVEIATSAENVMRADEVFMALLSVAIVYGMQKAPPQEIAALLADAAEKLNGINPPTAH